MIPALRMPDSECHGRQRSAFGRAGAARPLDVWVDTANVEPSRDLDHLLGFAGHPSLRFVTTTPAPGARVALLVVANGHAGVNIQEASSTAWIGGGPVPTWEALVDRWAPGAGPEQRDALLKSALLATVADLGTADVFVTDATIVRDKVDDANGMSAEQALAIVGLYLRSQDDFTVTHEPPFVYNRGLYYRLLASELLPSWGPAWRALVPHGSDGSPSFLNGLGHALIVRIGAVLRARDRAHLELRLPPSNDTADEFLIALDALVLTLDACFDVLARVLNDYHQIGKDAAARWRSQTWVRQLLARSPALAAVVGPGSPFADMTTLLGHLRKSIHGVPLQTIANSVGSGVRNIENLLVLPPGQRDELSSVFARWGGPDSWGLRPGIDDLFFVDPTRFVEVMTRYAVAAVDATIAAQVGPDAEQDRRGAWGDTPVVLHQLRALSGTVGWSAPPPTSLPPSGR